MVGDDHAGPGSGDAVADLRLSRRDAAIPEGARADEATTAFTALYREALTPVYSYLVNRCRSRAIAEDLVQDVFAAALVTIQQGTTVSTAWVMRVARNKMVDHFRRERIRRVVPGADRTVAEEVVIWQGDPSRDAAVEALNGLAGDRRSVLVLRHMDGLSVPEVAEVIGRSVHATESLLVRARMEFKRRFVELSHE
ncbi:MAG: polymerase sigma-70 factor, subfamily [Actinomycetota bacterium]|jgi:RNA polymerase sigma-70 factor (ECF subfamily)